MSWSDDLVKAHLTPRVGIGTSIRLTYRVSLRSNKRWLKFQLIWEIQRGGTSVLVRLEFQAIFVTRKIHRIVVVTAVVVVVVVELVVPFVVFALVVALA